MLTSLNERAEIPFAKKRFPVPSRTGYAIGKTIFSMRVAMAALLIGLVLAVLNSGFGAGGGSGLYVIGMLAQIIAMLVAAVYSARAGQGTFSVIAATRAIITLLVPFMAFFGFLRTR